MYRGRRMESYFIVGRVVRVRMYVCCETILSGSCQAQCPVLAQLNQSIRGIVFTRHDEYELLPMQFSVPERKKKEMYAD